MKKFVKMKTNIKNLEKLIIYHDILEKCFYKLIQQNGSNSYYYYINNKRINKIKNVEEFMFHLQRSTNKLNDVKAFETLLTDTFTGFSYIVAGVFNNCFTVRDFINHKPHSHYTKSIQYMVLIDSTNENFKISSYSDLKDLYKIK